MKKVTREHVIYAMSADDCPAAEIWPGEQVCFETYDCYQGNLLPEGNTFVNVDRRYGNPATGPVYVHGAKPGDTLQIHIDRLEVGPVGILDIGPTSGVLKGIFPQPVIKRIPVRDGHLYYDGIPVPISPMIGVIGVAPEGEAVSTKAPGNHGGNMDCTKIEEGATLYLPISVEGALLSTGDFHAIMGEGEVANCGVEIEGTMTLTVDVMHGTGLKWPMLENDTQWITIACGQDLDEAAERAVQQMYQFLTEWKGLEEVDAGMLIDMVGDLIVCQIVNPLTTVRMEVSKWLIEKMQQKYRDNGSNRSWKEKWGKYHGNN